MPAEIDQIAEYPFKRIAVSKEKSGGYAGVALLSKVKPIDVEIGTSHSNFDDHARLITAEFEDFYALGVYVLNSGSKLINLGKRQKWEEIMRAKLKKLDKIKPVIYVGDMNVAHNEIGM